MFLQTVYEMTLQLMNRNLGPNIIALVRIVVWYDLSKLFYAAIYNNPCHFMSRDAVMRLHCY